MNLGKFTGPPPKELWQLPNVVITPHTSGWNGCSAGQGPGVVLRESGVSYVSGQALLNVLDWERGY